MGNLYARGLRGRGIFVTRKPFDKRRRRTLCFWTIAATRNGGSRGLPRRDSEKQPEPPPLKRISLIGDLCSTYGRRAWGALVLALVLFTWPAAAWPAATIDTPIGLNNGDGYPAAIARVSPKGIALDPAGNLLIADTFDNRIRRVDAHTGRIQTVAGIGLFGFTGDGGSAEQARLAYPTAVVADGGGNIFFSDQLNHRVRRIDAWTGLITTYAGNGRSSFSGDGGLAINASLFYPAGLAITADGSLLIADSSNHRVRRVSPLGVITTVAGDSGLSYNGDGQAATNASLSNPTDVVAEVDGGGFYVVDRGHCRVRRVDVSGKISTVAGTGVCRFSGDGGPAIAADLNGPWYIGIDRNSLYIAETIQPRLRRVDLLTGIITTASGGAVPGYSGDGGPATEARLDGPAGIAFETSGAVLIAESAGGRVRRIAPNGQITTVVGSDNGDGFPAKTAKINPKGIALGPHGDLYIADSTNNRVRRVGAASGLIGPVAGSGEYGSGGDGGAAVDAQMALPMGVAVDAQQNVYVSDQLNQRVRRIDGQTGVITTIAGNGTAGFSGDGGPASGASLSFPAGLALAADGSLLIADSSNQRVRRLAPDGIITTIAGSGLSGFDGDGGPATSARLNNPTGVALDGNGDIYIADRNNCRIRRVDASTGTIETVAGAGKCTFTGDGGPARDANLNGPQSLALSPTGDIFVGEEFMPRVRRISAAGTIETLAGTGTPGVSGDGGPAAQAQLKRVSSLAFDPSAGVLYVSDSDAGNVRAVSLDGTPPPGIVAGDCNGDGFVSAGELAKIIAIIFTCDSRASGCAALPSHDKQCFSADRNGDGMITAGEIAYVIWQVLNTP